MNSTCLLCYTALVILLLWLAIPINEASDISKSPMVDLLSTADLHSIRKLPQTIIKNVFNRENLVREFPYIEHDIVFKRITCISNMLT